MDTYVSLYEWRHPEDFTKRFNLILHNKNGGTLQSTEVDTEEEADAWAASLGAKVTKKDFKPKR